DLRSCLISRLAGWKSPLKSSFGLGPKPPERPELSFRPSRSACDDRGICFSGLILLLQSWTRHYGKRERCGIVGDLEVLAGVDISSIHSGEGATDRAAGEESEN